MLGGTVTDNFVYQAVEYSSEWVIEEELCNTDQANQDEKIWSFFKVSKIRI